MCRASETSGPDLLQWTEHLGGAGDLGGLVGLHLGLQRARAGACRRELDGAGSGEGAAGAGAWQCGVRQGQPLCSGSFLGRGCRGVAGGGTGGQVSGTRTYGRRVCRCQALVAGWGSRSFICSLIHLLFTSSVPGTAGAALDRAVRRGEGPCPWEPTFWWEGGNSMRTNEIT